MPQEVRGVVAKAKGEPVSIETIVIPDPGPGEAVVKIQACGVCHTDLHYREGGINDEFPFCWATRPRVWYRRYLRVGHHDRVRPTHTRGRYFTGM